MCVRVITRLSLLFVILTPCLVFAQHNSIPQRQSLSASTGTCELWKQSKARFESAKNQDERVAFLRQHWDSYEQQKRLKLGFLDNLCSTLWDVSIFEADPSLIKAAKIPIDPEALWADITGQISILKTYVDKAEQKEETRSLVPNVQRNIDFLQTTLTDKDPAHSVLANFVEVKFVSGQAHTPIDGSTPNGWQPIITVMNRAMTFALTDVHVSCLFQDANGNIIWQGVISTSRIPPLETVRLVADGKMIALGAESDSIRKASFYWGNVRFDLEPSKIDARKALGDRRN